MVYVFSILGGANLVIESHIFLRLESLLEALGIDEAELGFCI